MQQGPRLQHEPALDGIRGAAVAAVLLFHAGHLRGGYLGVDLFFTLSGFLITSLLLAEVRSRGGVRLGAFWARRARRLLPALAVLFVIVATYAWFVAKPNELDQIRWDGIWTAFYAANWRAVLAKANYWNLFAAPSPFQHTWSLAIEEQFYLVWPIVLFFVARKTRNVARTTMLLASAIAVLGSAWLILGYDAANQSRSYYGTDTRLASIAFGAALAGLIAASPRARALPPGARVGVQVVGWAGLVAIVWLWCTLDGTSDRLYQGGLTLAAIAATCVIAAVMTHREGLLARGLSFRPLCALGLISYGVYLYHWPIYVYLTPARTGHGGWWLTIYRVSATLVVSVASYFFVERPVRRGVGTWRTMAFIAPAVAAVATLALVTTTVGAHPIVDEAAGALDNTVAMTNIAAHAPKGTHRLMLAGSSIAALFAGPIRKTPEAKHLVVLNRAVIGCGFPDGIRRVQWPNSSPIPEQSASCGQTWRDDVRIFQPEAVLFIPGTEPGPVHYELASRRDFVAPCSAVFQANYRASLLRHLRDLTGPHTTVYLPTFAYEGLPFITAAWYHNDDCINAVIRSVASTTPHVRLIDLGHHMCARLDAPCAITIEGYLLIRPDGTHYSGPGAVPVASWILNQMHLGAS